MKTIGRCIVVFEWGLIFFVMGLAGTLGLLVGTFLGGIPFVYSLPYLCWFYWNAGTKGLPKDISWNRTPIRLLWHQAANATKIYHSWITGKPHNITDF